MRSAGLIALLIACAASALSGPAAAAARVDASHCPGLDAQEVARLLDLEISTIARSAEAPPSFDLELSCVAGVMRMSLFDPSTSKRLERSIPAPAQGVPGRERDVALAASQLLVASWLELLVQRRSPKPTEPLPPPQPSPVALRAALQNVPDSKPSALADLGLSSGLVWRDHRAPTLLFAAGASATLWVSPQWSARLEAGLEHGTAQRSTGSVDLWLTSIGVGGGWRTPVVPGLDWEVFAIGGPAFVELAGSPRSADYVGRSARALSANAWLRTGPALRLGQLRLATTGYVGALLVAPDGAVAADRDVGLAGVSFGALLEASWEVRSVTPPRARSGPTLP